MPFQTMKVFQFFEAESKRVTKEKKKKINICEEAIKGLMIEN